MGLYKVVRADGSVEYTDVPSGAGQIEAVRPGSSQHDEAYRHDDAKAAEALIREAQKRIPKVADYLEYLGYLRHNSPIGFNHVMNELRREDLQTWLKLQKYPQFRPLHQTALGLKAGSNLLGAGVGLATGKFTGSVEKWMESTLKDLMKRDRFGPYADVLGTKASTLPSKTTIHSNSRLGQYMKVDEARLVSASRAAAKDLELSKAGMRAARGAFITRPFSFIPDVGMAALRPENGEAATQLLMRRRLDLAAGRNPAIADDTPMYERARDLLARGEYGKLDALLRQYE